MIIFYEQGLKGDATFLAEKINQIFSTKVDLREEEMSEYLVQNTLVGGYEVREDAGREFELILTEKDLFVIGATSRTDDYVYGYCSDSGLFYFSVARLKSSRDTPVTELEVSQDVYEKRLAYIAVHEMGHWFVKDARHMKKYFYTNSETGHQQDNGWHCINEGCVMRAVDDLAMLDQRAWEGEPAFCTECKASLRAEHGMPALPS